MSNLNGRMAVVFLVDVSGSMYGQKIEAVNAAIAECLGVLEEARKKGRELKIGYVIFHESMSDLVWKEDVGRVIFKVKPNSDGFYYLTSFSCLYNGICNFLCNAKGIGGNICLILVTDGKPIDLGEYVESLERAKSLELFRTSERYVALVGKDANIMDNDVLEFVGFKADRIVQMSDLPSELAKSPILAANGGGTDDQLRYSAIFGD